MKQKFTPFWLTALLMSVCQSLWSYNTKINGIYYKTYVSNFKDLAEVTYQSVSSSNGQQFYSSDYKGNIVIPNTIPYGRYDYSVISIGDHAFDGCTLVTGISIPNSVTSIGGYAFYGCTSLASIVIPNSVTSIGFKAFYGCSGLSSIEISNSVTSLGSYLFYGCEELDNIVLPNKMKTIGDYVFAGCTNLTNISIPNSITNIGNCAFLDCPNLLYKEYGNGCYLGNEDNPYLVFVKTKSKEITTCEIHEDCILLADASFSGCSNLTNITIPNGVKYIGKSCFYNCTDLSSIIIPNNVTSIGASAFRGCNKLKTVEIPSSVSEIVEGTFFGCSSLESITMPYILPSYNYKYGENNGQKTPYPFGYIFGTSYFDGAEKVSVKHYEYTGSPTEPHTYYVPSSLKFVTITGGRIPFNAFTDFTMLASVSISNNVVVGSLPSFNDNKYAFTGVRHIFYSGSSTACPWGALYMNGFLDGDFIYSDEAKTQLWVYIGNGGEVVVPNDVKIIGIRAFDGCTSLKSVSIPENVESIGAGAFRSCPGKLSVNCEIGDNAFASSKFDCIEIGNSVKTIGKYAFSNCVCKNIIVPNNVTSIGEGAFSGFSELESIELPFVGDKPHSSTDAYQYPFGYIFGTIDYEGGEATSQSYYGSTTDNTISSTYYIPVTLHSVTITSGYDIPYGAFHGCKELTSIYLHSDTKYIGGSAFRECTGLKIFDIPKGATKIDHYAFYNCSSITSVVIPESMSMIGNDAFSGCAKLAKVTIEDSNEVLSVGYKSNTSNASYFYGLFVDCPIKELYIGRDLDYSTRRYHSSYPGNGAPFERNAELKYITAEGDITTIGDYCFNGCNNIQSLIIGSGITKIGTSSFGDKPIKTFWLTNTPPTNYKTAQGCVNYAANDNMSELTNVEVYRNLSSMFVVNGIRYVLVNPAQRTCDALDLLSVSSDSILSIESKVAYRNINLSINQIGQYFACKREDIKELNIDEGIVAIKSKAFSDCSSLQNVQLGNDITTLGDSAFAGAITLQTVDLGETLTTICNATFEGCQVLQNLAIPNAVTSIGAYAFSRCSSINSILLPQSVNTISDNAFKGCTSLFNVVVENRTSALSVGSNGNSALFADCPLDSVYIGGKISYNVSPDAGYSPFYRNTTLRTVVIADNETEIHDNEFYGCTNLKNVTIGDGVKKIGDYAFSGCSKLKSFIFGASMESIGKEAFSDCTVLTSLYSEATTPPTCGNQALEDINKWECTLYVPTDNIAQYQEAEQWRDFFFIEANPLVEPQEPSPYLIADGSALTNTQDETFRYLNYTRTFSNTHWQALYVPFAIPVDSLTKYGLQVAELNDTHQWDWDGDGNADSTRLEFFTLKSGSTEPNYPYLIKADETMELVLNLKDTEVKASEEKSYECSSLKQRFTFVGTYTGVSGAEMYNNNYYGMSGGGLKRVSDATVSLKPQRWYMKIENKNGSPVSYYAPSIRFCVDGIEDESETTSIASMISGNREEDDGIFGLDGIRHTNASLKPGFYVHQGKKLVIR